MADSREPPEFETLTYRAPTTEKLGKESYKSHHFEQPNKNLMIIEEIEGLMSQVNDKLNELRTEYEDKPLRLLGSQALEEIDLFQKTTLFELRKAFE